MNKPGDTYIDAVSIALIDQGRVLLVKRGKEPAKGKYAFPGGRVEPGESLERAVKRELKEETGLEAFDIELLEKIFIDRHPRTECGYRLHVYTGKFESGELKAGDDAETADWYSIEEVANIPATETSLRISHALLGSGKTELKEK